MPHWRKALFNSPRRIFSIKFGPPKYFAYGRTKKIKVIIISGMSGAGKTHAADWFEDHGYYCIDNMPPSLIKSFLELSTGSSTARLKKFL